MKTEYLTTALMLCAASEAALASPQTTFVVNSTVDAPDVNPGDGICADANGNCTLRAAIQEGNAAGSHVGVQL